MKLAKILLFVFVLSIFTYLRLTPIINQTVPYTYDQGRDFLKVAQIVTEKKLTFIGPTTGINGVFHGAWWYYLIVIPFTVFNGNPIGFYYFMFFLSLFANLIFTYFIYKEFDWTTSLIFFAFVSISPYFSALSIFASNNIVTPYAVGFFIISVYYLFKSRKSSWLFFTSLFLGFVLEFEVSFGLFIIPIFFLLGLFFKTIRNKFSNLKNFGLFLSGFIIPFTPRLLFEIKNKFIQTKALMNYLLQPRITNPKPMSIVIQDRIKMFWSYLRDIFYNQDQIIAIIFIGFAVFVFLKFRKKIVNYSFVLFLILLSVFLFLFSLLYRDNFWANYYEGIQYVFLFLLISIIYTLTQIKSSKIITYLIILFLLIFNVVGFAKNIKSSKSEVITGLKSANLAIKYIYQNVGKDNFCLKVYTPPVIPYTYDYLTSYYSRVEGFQKPSIDFANNQCWYIIEDDFYKSRLNDWKKGNIPKEATLIKSKVFTSDYIMQLWSLDN